MIAYAMPLRIRDSITGMAAKINSKYGGLSKEIPLPCMILVMNGHNTISTKTVMCGAKSKRARLAIITAAQAAVTTGMTATYHM